MESSGPSPLLGTQARSSHRFPRRKQNMAEELQSQTSKTAGPSTQQRCQLSAHTIAAPTNEGVTPSSGAHRTRNRSGHASVNASQRDAESIHLQTNTSRKLDLPLQRHASNHHGGTKRITFHRRSASDEEAPCTDRPSQCLIPTIPSTASYGSIPTQRKLRPRQWRSQRAHSLQNTLGRRWPEDVPEHPVQQPDETNELDPFFDFIANCKRVIEEVCQKIREKLLELSRLVADMWRNLFPASRPALDR